MQPIDYSGWFSGKSFTTDWISIHIPVWIELLAGRRQRPLDVLEIGSWEGRSAVFFLNFLPDSHITCIDTFAGSPEHEATPQWRPLVADIEKRFDGNLAEFSKRFEKIKDVSHQALSRLALSRGATIWFTSTAVIARQTSMPTQHSFGP